MSTVSNTAQNAVEPMVIHDELRRDSNRETSLSGGVPTTERVGSSLETDQDSDAPSVDFASGLQASGPSPSTRSRITFDGKLAFILRPSTWGCFDQLSLSWEAPIRVVQNADILCVRVPVSF